MENLMLIADALGMKIYRTADGYVLNRSAYSISGILVPNLQSLAKELAKEVTKQKEMLQLYRDNLITASSLDVL